MSGRQGAQWALFDQAIVSAANFLTGLLVARSLGASDLAAYSLAFTTINGLSSVQRAVVSQPMNILGAQETPEQRRARYHGLVRLQAWLWPACVPVVVALGCFYFPDPWLIAGTLFFLLAFCLQDMVRRFHYSGGEDVRQALPIDLLAFGGQLAVLLVGWELGRLNAGTVLWWMGAPLLLAFVWGQRRLERLSPPLDRSATSTPADTPGRGTLLREHWGQSQWIALSIVLFLASSQLLPFQIASFGDPKAVADYHAANVLMNALNVVRFTIGNYLPGRAASVLAINGMAGLRRYLGRLTAAYLALGAVALALFAALGPWLIEWLFKGQYPGAERLIGPMAAIHLLAMSSLVTTTGAQVLGETRLIFLANVAATVAAWGLGPWLIVHHGMAGALMSLALGLLVPALLQALQLPWLLRRTQPVSA
jgi:O-antigen/teichoic acid export membrane protein